MYDTVLDWFNGYPDSARSQVSTVRRIKIPVDEDVFSAYIEKLLIGFDMPIPLFELVF